MIFAPFDVNILFHDTRTGVNKSSGGPGAKIISPPLGGFVVAPGGVKEATFLISLEILLPNSTVQPLWVEKHEVLQRSFARIPLQCHDPYAGSMQGEICAGLDLKSGELSRENQGFGETTNINSSVAIRQFLITCQGSVEVSFLSDPRNYA